MANRYEILLGKPMPEVVYKSEYFLKTGTNIFSNDRRSKSGEKHKCIFKKTFCTQKSLGFVCSCDKFWIYMDSEDLMEWEKKVKILKKRREQRIKKGFTSK